MPVHSVPTTCSLRCVFTPLKVVVVLEVLKVVMVHCLSANFFKSARLAHLLSLPYCFGFNKCLSSLFADSHWPSAATLCFNQKLLFHSARAHPCAFSFSGTCIFLSMTSSTNHWSKASAVDDVFDAASQWCRLESPLSSLPLPSLIYHRTILDNDAKIAHHRAQSFLGHYAIVPSWGYSLLFLFFFLSVLSFQVQGYYIVRSLVATTKTLITLFELEPAMQLVVGAQSKVYKKVNSPPKVVSWRLLQCQSRDNGQNDKGQRALAFTDSAMQRMLFTSPRNCWTACTVDRTQTSTKRTWLHLRTSSDAAILISVHSSPFCRFSSVLCTCRLIGFKSTYLLLMLLVHLPPSSPTSILFNSVPTINAQRKDWQSLSTAMALFEPSFYHHRPLTIATCNFIISGLVREFARWRWSAFSVSGWFTTC